MRGHFSLICCLAGLLAPLAAARSGQPRSRTSPADPIPGDGTTRDDCYTAAVVEFASSRVGTNASATLARNTDEYVRCIEAASEQNADIVVFPEDGLTSLYVPARSQMDSWTSAVPSPLDEYVPCTGNRSDVNEVVQRLSCAARRNRVYVVANVAERVACGPGNREENSCAGSTTRATRYHNTNVVFDRAGKVIARYRKVNLYGEPRFSRTVHPEIVTFDTDFGVKFGTFVCFDILFSVPALNLSRTEAVSNIVFTTAWFSEAPFLTAVQTQFGWAYAQDVNLLASGYHRPEQGNVGSGIYLGRDGIANATMLPDHRTRLLISRVPKSRGTGAACGRAASPAKREARSHRGIARDHRRAEWRKRGRAVADEISFLRDDLRAYASVPVNGTLDQTVCHRDFCCDFRARISSPSSSPIHYRALVYNGTRLYGTVVQAGIRVCGFVRCSGPSISSCGYPAALDDDSLLHELAVTARYDADSATDLVMPSVLDSSILPFEQWTYTESSGEDGATVSLVLTEPRKDVGTFALYARHFADDEWRA